MRETDRSRLVADAARLGAAPRGMRVPAVEVEDLRHVYGIREALAGVTLTVFRGEIFGLLGPNGGGKTTLFKILCTLMPVTQGRVRLLGHDLGQESNAVRRRLGVVFQRPSLDPKLTVLENLRHHGHLYGLRGEALRTRAQAMLDRLGLPDRARDRVETLSGGLQRRTELAKALMHQPELLLLDEPSTGLDPGARRVFTRYLGQLREQDGVTVLLTTHILDEAERCDRVGILHHGKLVALGTPDELKSQVGGDVVVIHSHNTEELQTKLRERFGHELALVDGNLRLELPRGHEFVREVVEAFPRDVESVTFGKPTLEDVFIHLTGHRLWGEDEARGEE
ncbi:MAG TPA: ABC transporter ATP-binding protein [Candidatus Methylomirabilis sp.]|nr:ABC transporter ATP-binding protein [Candidatus Methylomirabilis sp.]